MGNWCLYNRLEIRRTEVRLRNNNFELKNFDENFLAKAQSRKVLLTKISRKGTGS